MTNNNGYNNELKRIFVDDKYPNNLFNEIKELKISVMKIILYENKDFTRVEEIG